MLWWIVVAAGMINSGLQSKCWGAVVAKLLKPSGTRSWDGSTVVENVKD